jgi:2-polyprenyl-6-methoxyphenol hydroxylase-like FAD-dependent oxidoreductase
MLLAQLAAIGVQVEWKHRVVEYYEDLATGKGGVVLDSEEKLEADLVVAADGLGTKSHKLVVGKKIEARSSGYAIYRTAYPVDFALVDPQVAERFELLENGRSVNEIWVG